MTTLGRKVLSYREKHNLTQTEFAEKIGVKQWHISSIETGEVTGKKGAMSVFKVKSFFKLLETNRVVPSKKQVIMRVAKVKKTRKTRKQSYKTQTTPVYITQDPLSLKIVSELKASQNFMWRVVLAGFAGLALLIALK